jgi:hypothetical protein
MTPSKRRSRSSTVKLRADTGTTVFRRSRRSMPGSTTGEVHEPLV